MSYAEIVQWRIEQEGDHLFAIRKGSEKHWATTAKDAVALLIALEEAGR